MLALELKYNSTKCRWWLIYSKTTLRDVCGLLYKLVNKRNKRCGSDVFNLKFKKKWKCTWKQDKIPQLSVSGWWKQKVQFFGSRASVSKGTTSHPQLKMFLLSFTYQVVRQREGVWGLRPRAAVLLQHHPGSPPLHPLRDLGGGVQPAGSGHLWRHHARHPRRGWVWGDLTFWPSGQLRL